jgi:hypothetical protein
MADEKKAQDYESGKGYEVKDRRMFDQDGNLKADEKAGAPPQTPPPVQETEKEKACRDVPPAERQLPPMDFGTFVLSIATAALVHMGDAHAEGEKPPEPNLPMARQTIDILEMLKDKTRGNLSAEEEKLLNDILFDLRMRFVGKCK